jgi:hypothetical protein
LKKQVVRLGMLSLGALGCGDEDVTLTFPDEVATAENAAGPTFWQHVAPILNDKCTACHQMGGIAPFPLDNYDDAARRATLIADMTENRIMPPYLMETGGDCGTFDESGALTDAEIATIGSWARGERAVGTPGAIIPDPELPPSLADGLDLFTPNFVPEIEGGPLAQFDEYRCFGIDVGVTDDVFVTGFEIDPGNAQIVHHVTLTLVDPNAPANVEGMTNAQMIERLRQDDPTPNRDGWRCFAQAGEGIRIESTMATWAPGAQAYVYPGGVGVRIRPDWRIVAQVHYNLSRPEVLGQSDSTRVRLQVQDSVPREAVVLFGDAFLGTLAKNPPDVLEPGNPSVKYTWTQTGAELGLPPGVSALVLSIGPHMHERGSKLQIEVGRDDSFTCQGRVNHWDFDWQRLYDYTAPFAFDAESQLRVSCEYDTSGDTAPVLPGWGTRNEMCMVAMTVALPPSPNF